VEIIAISRDLAPSQAKFKELVKAQNTFLSDVDAIVIKRYGAQDDARKIAKRYYFLIDENGKIIWRSVTGALLTIDPLLEQINAAIKGAGQ
jgi:peroxiredoxin